MKAIQVVKPRDVRWVDLPMPEITEANQVRVKVKAAGVCGSDIHIAHGTNVFATYPRIIGHEVSGEVESIGSAVEGLAVGDLVVLEPIAYCGECYACKNGRPNVCQNLQVYGVHRDGGFCQYIVVPASRLYKVPSAFSARQAAAIEPFTIGAQCAWRGGVKAGDTVLVTGAGPMGLIAVDTCKALGATVIVAELNDYRLEMAKAFGADFTINPSAANLRDELMNITSGEGPNVILEATGVPELISSAIELVSVAGRVVPLGFGREPVPIDFAMVTKKEVGIFGSRLQTYKFEPVIKRLANNLGRIDMLINKVYPAKDYAQAFEDFTAQDSKVCKAILEF